MTDRELLQMALDALLQSETDPHAQVELAAQEDAAIEALRARLAQPEQGPEMWVHDKRGWVGLHEQPQREWQGLTDEEINDLAAIKSGMPLYRAIEQAIKEKNA